MLRDGREWKELEEVLDRAYRSAREAIDYSEKYRRELLRIISGIYEEVNWGSRSIGDSGVAEAFSEVKRKLDILAQGVKSDLSNKYKDLERDARFVTVMLFGRTKAGKSTTMEALTRGKGRTIGRGKQHTTKEVKAYYFPPYEGPGEPSNPCLRIVDTPGIEGFKGEELEEKALRFVERSNHVFFVLSDDKASSDELEHFGKIRAHGKGITVILNVKCADKDLDLLVEERDEIFRPKELKEHKERISNYISRHFNIPAPVVIPIHARAAWLANSDESPPQGVSREALRKASGIEELEKRLIDFIKKEAVPAQLKKPFDLLIPHIEGVRDVLLEGASECRELERKMESEIKRYDEAVRRALRKCNDNLGRLRVFFERASHEIPYVVDKTLNEKRDGSYLSALWEGTLKNCGVTNCGEWFAERCRAAFKEEERYLEGLTKLAEKRQVVFSRTDVRSRVDSYIKLYHKKHEDASSFGTTVGRGIGKSIFGFLGACLGGPFGWIGTFIGSVLVSKVGESINESLRKEDQEALTRHKEKIKRELRNSLHVDYSNIRNACCRYLNEVEARVEKEKRDKQLKIEGMRRLRGVMESGARELDLLLKRVRMGLTTRLHPDLRGLRTEPSAIRERRSFSRYSGRNIQPSDIRRMFIKFSRGLNSYYVVRVNIEENLIEIVLGKMKFRQPWNWREKKARDRREATQVAKKISEALGGVKVVISELVYGTVLGTS